MKLYTEEQVRHAIKMARSSYNIFTTPFIYNQDEVLQQLTPIEPPSDEEIIAKSKQEPDNSDIETAARIGYVAGAKWMRDKIQGGKQ